MTLPLMQHLLMRIRSMSGLLLRCQKGLLLRCFLVRSNLWMEGWQVVEERGPLPPQRDPVLALSMRSCWRMRPKPRVTSPSWCGG